MLAQGITSWLSCKQKSVVFSSTKTEYMALSDCSCQLVWTSNLLSEIGFDIPVPYLYGDNLRSLFWSTNPVQEKRSKHIDIWYHYVRDAIEDDKIKPYCKGTPNMPLRSPLQSSGATQKPIQYYYVILGLTPIIPRALRCHPAHFPCSDPGYQCRDTKTL